MLVLKLAQMKLVNSLIAQVKKHVALRVMLVMDTVMMEHGAITSIVMNLIAMVVIVLLNVGMVQLLVLALQNVLKNQHVLQVM